MNMKKDDKINNDKLENEIETLKEHDDIEELDEEIEKIKEQKSSETEEVAPTSEEIKALNEEIEKYNDFLDEENTENLDEEDVSEDDNNQEAETIKTTEKSETSSKKLEPKPNSSEKNNPNRLSKRKKQKIIICTLVVLIVLSLIIGGISIARLNNTSKNYKSIDDFSEEDKKIAGIVDDKETDSTDLLIEKNKEDLDKKAKEATYTKSYIEYEKLSEEEKSKVEDIPEKEIKSIELLDDIEDEIKVIDNLPAKYNLKDDIHLVVDDQKQYGLCWAFATLESMETNYQLKYKKEINLSEIATDYLSSNKLFASRTPHDGGNFEDIIHEANIKGIPQEKDNYRDLTENEIWELLDEKDTYYITDYIYFPTITKKDGIADVSDEELQEFRKLVKSHIMKNGSVYASINSANSNNGKYWFSSNTYFTDHAVSIVGWDDNYPKENFVDISGGTIKKPIHDGAYIIKNSWGEQSGDKGYYYISYDDSTVESSLKGVLSVSKKKKNYLNEMPEYLSNLLKDEYQYQIKKDDEGEYVFNSTLKSIKYLSITAADNLDNNSFNKLIEYLPELSTIQLEEVNIFDLSKLSELHNLNLISINNIHSINDFSSLGEIKSLRMLHLKNVDLTDISFVTSLQKLTSIDVSNNNIYDISPLSSLQYLSYITLDNNHITDLSPLKNLENISTLSASNNTGIYNYSLLKKLSMLNLSDCGITSLEDIETIKTYFSLIISNNKLTELPIIRTNTDGKEVGRYDYTIIKADNNMISDISKLNQDGIYQLNLNNNNVRDLSKFEKYNIYTLSLVNNNIDDTSNFSNKNINQLDLSNNKNIKLTENLNSISILSISNCGIKDLDSVSMLNNVRTLILSDNEITNLKGLEKLDNVKVLTLDNNKLEALDDIPKSNIETLNVCDNNIKTLDDFSNLDKLSSLNLTKNKNISNYSNLKTIKNLNYLYLDDIGKINLNDINGLAENTSISLNNNKISGTITGNYDIVNLENSKFENAEIKDITFSYLTLYNSSGDLNYTKIFSKVRPKSYMSINFGDYPITFDLLGNLDNDNGSRMYIQANRLDYNIKFTNNKYEIKDLSFRRNIINSYIDSKIKNGYYNDNFSVLNIEDNSKDIRMIYRYNNNNYSLKASMYIHNN